MKTVKMNLKHNDYNICIKKGLFKEINKYIKTFFKGKKIIVITDKNIFRLYGKELQKTLEKLNYSVNQIVIEPGEKSKYFSNLENIYKDLIKFEITRGDLIIAFGGGVGDLSGFVSATYLRGTKLIQIPTSLLAMVDSSIGGKVAVNLNEGKNLVGTFYHPEVVLIDPELLKTLPQNEFNNGMAEIIKYGCIYDKDLFNKILNMKENNRVSNEIESIIHRCVQIKSEIVAQDEYDYGQRMLLNFGHTLGHAIEKVFNYEKYTHGEAVAIGMYQITKVSQDKNNTEMGTIEQIKSVLQKYNLPIEIDNRINENFIEVMMKDKKRNSDSINLIILKCIGQAEIISVEISELNNYFKGV